MIRSFLLGSGKSRGTDPSRVGLLPERYIRRRAPDDLRYGTWLTNAISFGLLLGAAGIVAAILYVFIRMGV